MNINIPISMIPYYLLVRWSTQDFVHSENAPVAAWAEYITTWKLPYSTMDTMSPYIEHQWTDVCSINPGVYYHKVGQQLLS